MGSAAKTHRDGKTRPPDYKSDLTRGNDDLVNFMEQKLEQQEKNLIVK